LTVFPAGELSEAVDAARAELGVRVEDERTAGLYHPKAAL